MTRACEILERLKTHDLKNTDLLELKLQFVKPLLAWICFQKKLAKETGHDATQEDQEKFNQLVSEDTKIACLIVQQLICLLLKDFPGQWVDKIKSLWDWCGQQKFSFAMKLTLLETLSNQLVKNNFVFFSEKGLFFDYIKILFLDAKIILSDFQDPLRTQKYFDVIRQILIRLSKKMSLSMRKDVIALAEQIFFPVLNRRPKAPRSITCTCFADEPLSQSVCLPAHQRDHKKRTGEGPTFHIGTPPK